jgi:FG-GAP-like repeat/RTX calcium-binding nonapeptide repeat (4 copies)
MATLYYSLQVSELHAPHNAFPNTYVDLGNGIFAPGIPEYQEVGTANFGHPIGVPDDEVWRHFTVSSEQFERPSDFGSLLTYDTYFFGVHGTTTFPKWGSVQVPDSLIIPPQYDHATLADGWSGSVATAASGDFLWTSPTTATYNLSTSLSLPGFHNIVEYGLTYAVKYIAGEAAKAFGVGPLWDAVNRAGTVSTALTNFVSGGTDTLTQLLNGFNTGMTPQQADALLQTFMDTTAFNFHQAAETVLGTGTGVPLFGIMEGIRLAEKWAVDPSTGRITHSEVSVEDGTRTGYFGEGAQFVGDPSYRNDVVLSGNSSDLIDTASDTSFNGTAFTERARIDFIAAGGGLDVIQSREGADVISAGFGNDRIVAGPGSDYINGGRGFDRAYYTGVISNYSTTHNANGSWTITDNRPGSPDGTDTLFSVEQLMFTNGAANPFVTDYQSALIATAPILQDFNEDGFSDIQWQRDSGQAAVWLLDGRSLASGAAVTRAGPALPVGPDVGPSWHLKGDGDFNADGRDDFLWQDDNGLAAIWLMNGTSVLTNGPAGPFNPGPSWQIKATSDFNNDGRSDILWQGADGTPAIWLMVGLNAGALGAVGPFNPGPSWQIKGTGDFDGDGKSDILWQGADGTAAIWFMNGMNFIRGGAAGSFNPGPSWQIKGTGDFDGNGKSDILWQGADGTAAIWLMDGLNTKALGAVGPFNPGPSWHVQGSGDYNGDGRSDILWQADNGTPAIWFMNGMNFIGGGAAGSFNPGADWHIIA